MAVRAISAQKGAGGRHIAELLAAAAEVPLYDGASVASLDSSSTNERLEFLRLERRFRRFNLAASSVAAALGLPDAVEERAILRNLPDILRTIVSRAARVSCVPTLVTVQVTGTVPPETASGGTTRFVTCRSGSR